jgi:hypothetical protein
VFSELKKAVETSDRRLFGHILWERVESIRHYLTSFTVENAPNPDSSTVYVNDALPRFLRTLEFVPLPPPKRILEIGSNPYFFHLLLSQLFDVSSLVSFGPV